MASVATSIAGSAISFDAFDPGSVMHERFHGQPPGRWSQARCPPMSASADAALQEAAEIGGRRQFSGADSPAGDLVGDDPHHVNSLAGRPRHRAAGLGRSLLWAQLMSGAAYHYAPPGTARQIQFVHLQGDVGSVEPAPR
jgi:hypothetical protein